MRRKPRRTFIGLLGEDDESVKIAAMYLARRSFRHFGNVDSFDYALQDKNKSHGSIGPIRRAEHLARLQRDAEDAGVKLVVFGITRSRTRDIPTGSWAIPMITYTRNLERFYRQLDPHMETIFE